ncbi:MAG: PPC domain-containing protein, partial [Beijerinckiaceae bacterium]
MPDVIETADAAASTTTLYTLGIGQIGKGTLATSNDHDFWRVNLTAGQQYTIALVGVGATPVRDTVLQLFGANGTSLIGSNDDGLSNNNSSLTFTAATTGSFYIDAGSYQNRSAGDYELVIATGTRPSFDTAMAVGVINSDLSWSAAPGAAATITWGARQSPAAYTVNGSNITTFTPLTAAQIATVQAVLASYSEIANLTFQQVNPGGTTNNATMLFG